jgi:plasmid stabilization system protein ParE
MITYKVTVTEKANQDEEKTFKYISEKFGRLYAENFRKKLIELFTLLAKQPFIGRPAKKDATLRVYIFSKQNKLIYKVIETEIVIVRLLHTNTNIASKF